jgi:hypothetical protein
MPLSTLVEGSMGSGRPPHLSLLYSSGQLLQLGNSVRYDIEIDTSRCNRDVSQIEIILEG